MLWLPARFAHTELEMDDLSDIEHMQAVTAEVPGSICQSSAPVLGRVLVCSLPASIQVCRDEITILKAFLSAEIDAILFGKD